MPPGPPTPILVRLRLIGQMEAWTVTSENVLPAGRKTRALLAAIALSGPRPALRGRRRAASAQCGQAGEGGDVCSNEGPLNVRWAACRDHTRGVAQFPATELLIADICATLCKYPVSYGGAAAKVL